MNFTFGILLYNQEHLVIETLESIKYQITNFGTDITCDLIIVDDFSSDKSTYIVKKWLESNANLFRNILFHINEYNQGMVIGQQYIIDNTKTEHLKIIAADDIFASCNIFKHYRNLNGTVIKSFIRVNLRNEKLQLDEDALKRFCQNKKYFSGKRKLTGMRRGCYFHTPSTIYKLQMYFDGKCQEFNKNFKYLEDDSTWYCMMKNIPNIEIRFLEDIIVLYRISDASVSNSRTNNILMPDFYKLHEQYRKDAKGIERAYFCSKIHDNIPKIFRLHKYVDFIRRNQLKFSPEFKTARYRQLKEKMEERIKEEKKYYQFILTCKTDFLKHLEGS